MALFLVSELPGRLAGNVLKPRLTVGAVAIPKTVCDTMFGRANLKVGVQQTAGMNSNSACPHPAH